MNFSAAAELNADLPVEGYFPILAKLPGVQQTGRTSSEQLGFSVKKWWENKMEQSRRIQNNMDILTGIGKLKKALAAEQQELQRKTLDEARKYELHKTARAYLPPGQRLALGLLSIVLSTCLYTHTQIIKLSVLSTTYMFGAAARRLKFREDELGERSPLLL
eukprot:Gregarina_sp_Poly_1__2169@NODE_1576_length_3804_cov_60_853893_g1042_i0_p2_GENE_NODE_1576_length_3804_cov_60_853893_g1042_i0NODE_1576_length_3804_cov_60_853893_g1042_i0_p2_ORF_typecomplete_len162_score26_78DnaJX/PF14308_6/0_2_NODE_1576_length_3804_cov_60_853893_g1042_i0418903